MSASIRLAGLVVLLLATAALDAAEKLPTVRDPRLVIELFAADPAIVTPTGLDVDHAGRVFALESNTHFPPEGYNRHTSDRLLVLRDRDGDGRSERPIVFADGFVHAMSVAVRTSFVVGQPDTVLVATRKEVVALWDDDGDLVADRRRRVLQLDTPGNYPHNGLAGFAFDGRGQMYIGLGENLGAAYKLIGSDKTTLPGGGEGGNIYRCRPDGSKLELFATGFWNPHASCVDAFGRLFNVDNDPDSLPPCRLMHIVAGGDYGYRFRNGRTGFHPFTSWNGEIPGTLPMVAGTGEAPSGIIAYESDGLPQEYIGDLLVTSWGDHRIDRFRLKQRGASFESVAEPLVQGGVNFRPVGLAVAPDGSLFCTDWVLRDYKVHGRGRVWRIRHQVSEASKRRIAVVDVATVARRPVDELVRHVRSPRLPLRRAAAVALGRTAGGRRRLKQMISDHGLGSRARIEVLWAMAGVDPEVEDFGFLRPIPNGARVAGGSSDVVPATIELLGTPQFPFAVPGTPRMLWADQPAGLPMTSPGQRARRAAATMRVAPLSHAVALLAADDPFLMAAVLRRIDQPATTRAAMLDAHRNNLAASAGNARRQSTLAMFKALATLRRFHGQAAPERLLADRRTETVVKRLIVQWIAERGRKDLRPDVERILDDPGITAAGFLATLAALDMLDGGNPSQIDKTPPAKYALPLLRDTRRPSSVRALALRLVDPADRALDRPLLERLLESRDGHLEGEVVRTLGLSSHRFAAELLVGVVEDSRRPRSLRADAVAGLGNAATSARTRGVLLRMFSGSDPLLMREALRSLQPAVAGDPAVRAAVLGLAEPLKKIESPAAADRDVADRLVLALTTARQPVPGYLRRVATPRPATVAAWVASLAKGGDVAAGRRLFFHRSGPACGRCHTVNGRGRRVGPDLSVIARSRNRRQLLESILEPSREVAPQFVTWSLVTTAGRVINGVIVYENRDKLTIEDVEGKQTELANTDVELRTSQKKSLMPEKLIEQMSVEEVRDLLAYLGSLR